MFLGFVEKNVCYLISFLVLLASLWLLHYGASQYYISSSEGISSELGEAIGKALCFMLFVYPIWKRRFLFKKGKGVLCFSVLFLLCSGYQSVRMKNAADQLQESEKEFKALIQNPPISEAECLALKQKSYSVQRFGDMSELLTLYKEISIFSSQEDIKLNKELEDAHLEAMVDTRNLCDPKFIQGALDVLQALGQEINASELRRKERIAQLDDQIINLAHYKTHPIKKAVVDGYNQRKERSLVFIKEYYHVLRDIIHELDSLLNFLLNKGGAFWNENGKMIFEAKEDAQRYNEHIVQIVELSASEERILKNSSDFRKSISEKNTKRTR